jgi:hypothetical protein
MSYFISPKERTDWRFDAQALAKDIQARWPGAHLESSEEPSKEPLSWTLTLDGRRLEGSVAKTRKALHLDGDVRACAAFAVWLRSKIPQSQELLFYDEGYSNDVVLRAGVTAAQVATPFLHA